MNVIDYDHTLLSLQDMRFHDLFEIMETTEDDILSERINQFLYALECEKNLHALKEKQILLLHYLDHAFSLFPDWTPTMETLGQFIEI